MTTQSTVVFAEPVRTAIGTLGGMLKDGAGASAGRNRDPGGREAREHHS